MQYASLPPLPEVCFYNILDFIPRHELCSSTCLVSKKWHKEIFNYAPLWRSIIIGQRKGRATHNLWQWLAHTELRHHVWRLVIEKPVVTFVQDGTDMSDDVFSSDKDDAAFRKVLLPNLQVVKIGATVKEEVLGEFVRNHPHLRGFIARKLVEYKWLPHFMSNLEFCFMPGRVYQNIWQPSAIIEHFLEDRLPVFNKMVVLGWARVKTHDDFHSLRMLFPNLKALLIRMPRNYELMHMELLKEYCNSAGIRTLLLDVPCENITAMDWEILADARTMQKLHIGRKRGQFKRAFRDRLKSIFKNLEHGNIVFHEGKFAILGELFEDFMGLKILKKLA